MTDFGVRFELFPPIFHDSKTLILRELGTHK